LTPLLLLIVRANGVSIAGPLEGGDVIWRKIGTYRGYCVNWADHEDCQDE
jgi:hypothetical protein